MNTNIFLQVIVFCCIWTSIIAHYEILHFCYFCRIYSFLHYIHATEMSHRIIRQIDTIFSLTYIITIHFTSFLIPQCMYRLIFWSFWTHPSVFDLVHLILHLYFILAILALWSYFFWLVMLSSTPVPLLWFSLIWTFDSSAALKNLPPFTIIWLTIQLTFFHSIKLGCNSPILTISFPHWHPLAFPLWTLQVLLVLVVVLLSFIGHSSKSNHSVLETFLLLYLLQGC